MTDDDLTRLRDEVAGVLEREYGCKPGMVHEGYGAECASVAHALALYRTFGCDHVAHVADALLPLLTRKIAEAWNAGYCTNRDPSAVKLAHLHNPYMQAPGGEQ